MQCALAAWTQPRRAPCLRRGVVRALRLGAVVVGAAGAWAFGWEALVAIGTLALAAATAGLAWSARQETAKVAEEAAAVKDQVQLQREQLEAGSRPLVLPIMGADDLPGLQGSPHVLIRNAGTGPALNVRGSLYWKVTAGGASSLHPQVLAAGAEVAAKVLGDGIRVHWATVVGYLLCSTCAAANGKRTSGSAQTLGATSRSRWSTSARPTS